MLCYMAIVAITSSGAKNARRYVEVMQSAGADVRVLTPDEHNGVGTHELMLNTGGLLLSGGPDIDPELYGEIPDPKARLILNRPLDDLELRVLEYALLQDMPILAICRGMQLLNVAFGGTLILKNATAYGNPLTTLYMSHQGLKRHQLLVWLDCSK